MLVRGWIFRLPGHNEVRYIRGGVATPPRKAKATMNCRAPVFCLFIVPVSCLDTAAVPGGKHHRPPPRAPVVCLVTVHVSCLDTAAVPGGKPPPGPPDPPSSTLWCWVTNFVVCLDTATVPGGHPSRIPPPRACPLVLGHTFIHFFLKTIVTNHQYLQKVDC